MKYDEAVNWLYEQLPAFHSQGAGAYKPGLGNTLNLAARFGNPHLDFPTIHVGGTNGKGSTAHTLAAVLSENGYKVGLYTSPHLLDFRERIRVNGKMIPREEVVEFVEEVKTKDFDIAPSFFEMTTIMAFRYFSKVKVDVAVIEVGLGGRLDSTNIIHPRLSVITNISLDHTDLLGPDRKSIAKEKAGIIKSGVPVVVGESDDEIRQVFVNKAAEMKSSIFFAEERDTYKSAYYGEDERLHYTDTPYGDLSGELIGECQKNNARTIITALTLLQESGFTITPESVKNGFANVCGLTGLMGRWMKISNDPLVICDTGHNPGGWEHISRQLGSYKGRKILLIGFVGDKDVPSILRDISHIPHCDVILTAPSIPRALSVEKLAEYASGCLYSWTMEPVISEGYKKALSDYRQGDMIYVGGSTYVVAEFMEYLQSTGRVF